MPDQAQPVLDTIAGMTAASLVNCDLDAREHMIARVAALVAADAPPLSYLSNAGPASDMGITIKDVQNILVAVAPIVGTARVVTAAGNITRALGFAIVVAENESTPNSDAADG
jgi:hypothetical protein